MTDPYSPPTSTIDPDAPSNIECEESKLILVRDSGWSDRIRKYKIMLDGVELCFIKNGEQLSFPISNGSHTLKAKIDWCGSNTIDFDVDNSTVTIDVRSNLRGLKILLSMLYIFIPNKWITLTVNASPET